MIRFKVRDLPAVTMRVKEAVVVSAESVAYEGPYEVTPKVEAQTLPTRQKFLKDDLKVLAVPFFEVDNQIGTTIYIASEV